ncbi:MAG: dihydroneopterin aldolase [Rhodomicrobium sp.]
MREKSVKHESSVSTQPRPEDGSSSYDKVRVRDLVLPMRLGIWNEEKGLTQRVRFTVEVSVTPGAHHPGDIESVISYDFIVAAIEKVAAEGHQLLTETVAEQIASYCLSDPRALEVRVMVEKLDRIPGASLGCEIVRVQSPKSA